MTENPGDPASIGGPAKTDVVVRLVGGLKRRGAWRVPSRTLLITALGGIQVDLTEADVVQREVVLTKVSLVGGVDVTVPPGVTVDVSGFVVVGRLPRRAPAAAGADLARLQVRCYGVFGGVEVHQR